MATNLARQTVRKGSFQRYVRISFEPTPCICAAVVRPSCDGKMFSECCDETFPTIRIALQGKEKKRTANIKLQLLMAAFAQISQVERRSRRCPTLQKLGKARLRGYQTYIRQAQLSIATRIQAAFSAQNTRAEKLADKRQARGFKRLPQTARHQGHIPNNRRNFRNPSATQQVIAFAAIFALLMTSCVL